MLDKAVGVVLGERESLSAVTHRATELLHRVVAEDLGHGVSRPRLLHLLEPAPGDAEVTRGASVDAVELLDPDLLDAGRQGRGVHVAEALGHDLPEFGLVVLPLRNCVVDDGCHSHRHHEGCGDEQEEEFAVRDFLDHWLLPTLTR